MYVFCEYEYPFLGQIITTITIPIMIMLYCLFQHPQGAVGLVSDSVFRFFTLYTRAVARRSPFKPNKGHI
jgi:hypothetical protein